MAELTEDVYCSSNYEMYLAIQTETKCSDQRHDVWTSSREGVRTIDERAEWRGDRLDSWRGMDCGICW